MNYLIFGKGTNSGDIGIAVAMLQDIQAADPNASFVYFADRPEVYSDLPELQGHVVELFSDISSSQNRRPIPSLLFRVKARLLGELNSKSATHLLAAASQVMGDIGFAARLLALRFCPSVLFRYEPELRRIVQHHAWADVVVRQGGPGWNDWVLRKKVLQIRLAYGALARYHNLPMVMYAQSFGPFEWPGVQGHLKRHLTRFMLNQTRLLTLRDLYSREALARLDVTYPRIVEAADVAWNLRPAPVRDARAKLDEYAPSNERPRLGLTLRSFHGQYGISEAQEQELISEFAVLCDKVIEHLGELIFLSTDYRKHGRRNDLDVMRLVQQRMQYGARFHVIEEELAARELKAIYGQMDLLISVRLHPSIFAMASGVPTLLIGYDPKCADAAEQMQMQDYHIDINKFRAEDAFNRISDMLARQPELTRKTERRAKKVKQRAHLSVQALMDLRHDIRAGSQ